MTPKRLKIPAKNSQREFVFTLSKVAGYKMNIQKSLVFLRTNNEQTENEIKKII
jgi:hypothetical protein